MQPLCQPVMWLRSGPENRQGDLFVESAAARSRNYSAMRYQRHAVRDALIVVKSAIEPFGYRRASIGREHKIQ